MHAPYPSCAAAASAFRSVAAPDLSYLLQWSGREVWLMHERWRLWLYVAITAGLLLAAGRATAFSTKVIFAADVRGFSRQSAVMDDADQARLLDFVEKANGSNPEVVIAVGHAEPGEGDAMALGWRRAKAVKFHLMQLGVPPNRIYIESKGSTRAIPVTDYFPNPRQRRVEVEFVGDRLAPPDLAGFSLMALWLTEMRGGRKPTQPDQKDEWRDETPLTLLPRVEPEFRARFVAQLQLAAIRDRDDETLRQALAADARASLLAAPVAPALYAQVFGTPFARDALRPAAARVAADDPRRLRAAERRWCQSPIGPPAAEAVRVLLPGPDAFTGVAADEQYRWVTCAAARPADLTWLRQHGGNLDALREDGWTTLHQAVLDVRRDAVAALLSAGANPNIRNKRGETPLHLVASSRYPMVWSPALPQERRVLWDLLVQAGASTATVDGRGRAPVEPTPR
jgi:outer membrane protein OmpA-like peptidoglycan-associated protein